MLISKILDLLNGIFGSITTKISEQMYNTMSGIITMFGVDHVLNIEKAGNFVDAVKVLEGVIAGIAITLLSCKLLMKLFNIYIVGIDGDETVSPFEYFKNYGKGIIIILCFTIFYGWFSEIIADVTRLLTNHLNMQMPGFKLGQTNLFMGLMLIIYFVYVLIFCVQMLVNGARMLVLRLGLPLGCVGLIDNDNGIYSVFIKKIIQTGITSTVQILLFGLSFLIIKQTDFSMVWSGKDFFIFLLSVVIMAYSSKVTQDLNEMFLASPGTGAGQKISAIGRGAQQVAQTVSSLRGKVGG